MKTQEEILAMSMQELADYKNYLALLYEVLSIQNSIKKMT